MNIVRIQKSNLKKHLDDLVRLNDEFLESLGRVRERTLLEKQRIIESMVSLGTSTVLLIALDEDGNAIGVSYYNFGSGYSCGGKYLWLNCIYIRSNWKKKGYGLRLLRHIEEDGRQEGIKLFTCGRDVGNEASMRLFESAGFQQTENMIMTKVYN